MQATKAIDIKTPAASNNNAVVSYLKGVQHEFKNISWPSRQQIIAETIIVIVVVAIFAAFTSLLDVFYGLLIGLIT